MWNPLTIHSYMSKCITTDNADSTRVVLLLKVTHATVKIDSHHKPPLASSDSSALPRAGIFSAGPSSQNGWQLRAALQDLAWHAEGCRGRQRRWPSSAVHRSASGWSRVLRQVLLRQLPVSTHVQLVLYSRWDAKLCGQSLNLKLNYSNFYSIICT